MIESPRDVQPGDILAGKYRVERILGRGGMGVVVAALHLDLHEKRAIKLMLPNQLGNTIAVERFLREARATVRLRSEHITQVYDVGRLESGAPYIVMELLHGVDLAQLLRKTGPLPIDLAVLYVFQACKALAEAHAAGIVHRDIKPSNLFLANLPDGSQNIKVVDFGISKQLPIPGVEAVDVTGANDIMGSLLYMSPEQMRSAKNVDGRTDVWALGAVLYKLVTNQVPFEASNHIEIFARVLDGARCEPPGNHRRDLEPALEAVILRCLAHDVAARLPSMADLMIALAPFLPHHASASEDGDDAITLHRPFPSNHDPITSRSAVHPAALAEIRHEGLAQQRGRPGDLRHLKHTIPIVGPRSLAPLSPKTPAAITTPPVLCAPPWPWPPMPPRAPMDSAPGSDHRPIPSSAPPPAAWDMFPSSFPPPPLFHPSLQKPTDEGRSRLGVARTMAASGVLMLLGAAALFSTLSVSPLEKGRPGTTTPSPVPAPDPPAPATGSASSAPPKASASAAPSSAAAPVKTTIGPSTKPTSRSSSNPKAPVPLNTPSPQKAPPWPAGI